MLPTCSFPFFLFVTLWYIFKFTAVALRGGPSVDMFVFSERKFFGSFLFVCACACGTMRPANATGAFFFLVHEVLNALSRSCAP